MGTAQPISAPNSTNLQPEWLSQLLQNWQPGWSLPQPFYQDAEVYRRDVDQVWRRGWLFAAHSCQLSRPGDFITLRVDTDSIVIIRGDDGQPRAFHNVCRHRGSLVCLKTSGHTARLVCPYHQWTYGRDGSLLSSRGMPDDFDKGQFGLHPVHARELEGHIFINLAAEPIGFESAAVMLSEAARPQGFGRAKVAHIATYNIRANWKLVWENNRECYHCNVNHPQYIRANFDHYNADDSTPRIRDLIAQAVARGEAKWAEAGLAPTHTQTGMTRFPDVERGIWFSANRTPLVDGYLSETMDGRLVAPLMGEYADADVGTLRMRSLPNYWNHSSCDHVVTTRLLPHGPELTEAQVIWLVREGAEEGRDYQLDRLLPFWQLTSEQDWEICERQQLGIQSSAYRPGPYSTFKEYNVESFVQWYLQLLTRP